MTPDGLAIRAAVKGDADAIWAILEPVIRTGESYALGRDMPRADALAYWTAPDRQAFVACVGETILGTYYLRANQAGGGAHVANAGYATHAGARGRGVARAMAVHSMEQARAQGFRAMQFNFVVESNAAAVHLWQSLGFDIVGRLPGAFDHPSQGFVDALVMMREL